MPFPSTVSTCPEGVVRLSCHFIWNARSGARPHPADMTLHGHFFRQASLFIVVEVRPDSLKHKRIYDPLNTSTTIVRFPVSHSTKAPLLGSTRKSYIESLFQGTNFLQSKPKLEPSNHCREDARRLQTQRLPHSSLLVGSPQFSRLFSIDHLPTDTSTALCFSPSPSPNTSRASPMTRSYCLLLPVRTSAALQRSSLLATSQLRCSTHLTPRPSRSTGSKPFHTPATLPPSRQRPTTVPLIRRHA